MCVGRGWAGPDAAQLRAVTSELRRERRAARPLTDGRTGRSETAAADQ